MAWLSNKRHQRISFVFLLKTLEICDLDSNSFHKVHGFFLPYLDFCCRAPSGTSEVSSELLTEKKLCLLFHFVSH